MRTSFKRILTLISISLGNSFIYRASFFTRIIVLAISLSAQFFFWSAAFSDHQEISSYNFNEFFSYLLIANLFYEFMIPNNVMVSDQIREGELNHFLLLPFSFMKITYWRLIGDRLAFFINCLLPIAVGLLIVNYFGWISFHTSFLSIALTLFFLLGGLTIHFLIDFGIGLLAFWFERSDFLFIVKEIVLRILAGLWFPFEILPKEIQESFGWLPFQFLGYTPAQALLNVQNVDLVSLFLLVGWVLTFYLANLLLWNVGIKKYQAYGA